MGGAPFRSTPRSAPPPEPAPPSNHAPRLRPRPPGLAPTSNLYPLRSPAHRPSPAHSPRCGARRGRSREPFLPTPTHTLKLTCRPDPRGRQTPSLALCGLSLTGGPRQSNFSSLGSGGKAANRPGSVAWKFDFASYWILCFVLTLLEFSRGCSAAEPRAHVFAVHSGAWPATLHPGGLAGKFRRISCSWGGTRAQARPEVGPLGRA